MWRADKFLGAGDIDDQISDLLRAFNLNGLSNINVEPIRQDPSFLREHRRRFAALPPVNIVNISNGSATMQAALAQERTHLKSLQLEAERNALSKLLDEFRSKPVANLEKDEKKEPIPMVSTSIMAKMSIKEQRESLPIFKKRQEFLQAFADNQVLIVIGETGSGKTTQMTQYLAEIGYASPSCKIGCTQPRRVAATTAAQRVSEEMGCTCGGEVGYSIRFDDCTSSSTKIKYMTDGSLLRECLNDPELNGYSTIILDEAHERSMDTDVLFGLLKAALKTRDDLKIIVTSATLNADKFSAFFSNAQIFNISGRTFPVEVIFERAGSGYVHAALRKAEQIHKSEPLGRDILIFLTGAEEIDTACDALYSRSSSWGPYVADMVIVPFYAALPAEDQARVFEPTPSGKRKVVIATNIAETSLTIDGIYYVIDPGYERQRVYSPKTGIDQLKLTLISRAQAEQRKGRAGRTGPGKCYRLYSEYTHDKEMLSAPVPEIQRANLANTVLQLKAMGIEDIVTFEFMDQPEPETIITALSQLHFLGALDSDGQLTELGRRMADLPLDPMLSKMLIVSVELGCSEEILTIVSMLENQYVFHRPKSQQALADNSRRRFNRSDGDHITLLQVFNAWRDNGYSDSWCRQNYIQAKTLNDARDVRKQLLQIMQKRNLDVKSCGHDLEKVRMAICSSYFFNAAKKMIGAHSYRTIVEGSITYLHPSSSLFRIQPQWVIYHRIFATSKGYMKEITPIKPEWLVKFGPSFYKFS